MAALLAPSSVPADSDRRRYEPPGSTEAPLIVPELRLAVGAPRTAIRAGVGIAGIARGRFAWSALGVIDLPAFDVDYSMSGGTDWSASDGGPHPELRAHLGWSVWQRSERFGVRADSDTVQVVDGEERAWRSFEGERQLSLFVNGGARVDVRRGELAIAAGPRLVYRRLMPNIFASSYTEGWVELRLLAFPKHAKLGFDFEAVVPWAPLFVRIDAAPQLGPDDDQATCNLMRDSCQPPYDPSAFNHRPGAYQVRAWFGVRIDFGETRDPPGASD